VPGADAECGDKDRRNHGTKAHRLAAAVNLDAFELSDHPQSVLLRKSPLIMIYPHLAG
jgi:hypothetical protein